MAKSDSLQWSSERKTVADCEFDVPLHNTFPLDFDAERVGPEKGRMQCFHIWTSGTTYRQCDDAIEVERLVPRQYPI
jgi:hypothetical protein